MRYLETGTFAEFEMTAEEQKTALYLSPETRAYIQNLKAQAALDIVNNVVNPEVGTTLDLMRQAELRGEIKAYAMLLSGDLPPQTSNENPY
jgi:hypothetical protein